ncbi:unnamed protein product [Vitrella brassicaformis CCMP3155]|uniref:Uncharacterized protein n=1 Tax=Vitrella brassicaformis (strain CCMP3155) TaxID=1169540 RepID=A0A0G4FD63_VITBC|nr:unnamed protein product [Vitrella brassicaformis CCMP3155]|eukprot:CEM10849.1 unnamed protein product [Vitrella brassicaformis CCMP3155]
MEFQTPQGTPQRPPRGGGLTLQAPSCRPPPPPGARDYPNPGPELNLTHDHVIRDAHIVLLDGYRREYSLWFQEQRLKEGGSLKEGGWYDLSCGFKATNMVLGRMAVPNPGFHVEGRGHDPADHMRGPVAVGDCSDYLNRETDFHVIRLDEVHGDTLEQRLVHLSRLPSSQFDDLILSVEADLNKTGRPLDKTTHIISTKHLGEGLFVNMDSIVSEAEETRLTLTEGITHRIRSEEDGRRLKMHGYHNFGYTHTWLLSFVGACERFIHSGVADEELAGGAYTHRSRLRAKRKNKRKAAEGVEGERQEPTPPAKRSRLLQELADTESWQVKKGRIDFDGGYPLRRTRVRVARRRN